MGTPWTLSRAGGVDWWGSHQRLLSRRRIGLVFTRGRDIGERSWDRLELAEVGHWGTPTARHLCIAYTCDSPHPGLCSCSRGCPFSANGRIGCGSLQSSLPCHLGPGGTRTSCRPSQGCPKRGGPCAQGLVRSPPPAVLYMAGRTPQLLVETRPTGFATWTWSERQRTACEGWAWDACTQVLFGS